MARLSQSDLAGLLDVVRTCETFPDLTSFRAGVLPELCRLIPYDTAAHKEHCDGGQIEWTVDPGDIGTALNRDGFRRLRHQHPFYEEPPQGPGLGKTLQLTDFLNQRQLRRLDIYEVFFKPLGIEHQLATTYVGAGGVAVAVPLNRTRRGFSERDRDVLELLRPHLMQIHRRAHARTQARRAVEVLDEAAQRAGRAVVLLGPNDTTQLVTGRARDWLRGYFASDPRGPERLPETVADWLRTARHRLNGNGVAPQLAAPLVAEGVAGRLTISFLPGTAEGESDALLLEERPDGLDPAVLRSLGLTQREVEVLSLADRGLTNVQIANELSISPSTVAKHLSHVNEKLGVPSRTAALARAREAAWSN